VANAGLEYAPEGGALFAGVDGSQTTHKYLSRTLGGLLNRYEQTAGIKAGYMVQPKTRVYVGYRRQIIHYSAGRVSNNKSHLAEIGIEGEIAPKVKGKISAGGQYKQYDEAPVAGQPKIARDSIVSTQLIYNPLERTNVVVTLSRAINEATFANNRFYISTVGNLAVNHRLPYKLTFGINAAVVVDKYPVPASPTIDAAVLNRRDDSQQGGANIDYDIQEWLKVGVGYLYRQRWSKNFTDQFNYEDHQMSVRLALAF
jgi:hypothetical protein